MSPKASLFLIGAPKAGTTALAAKLAGHPAVEALPIKEPAHFGRIDPSKFRPAYKKLVDWSEPKYFSTTPLQQRHQGFVQSADHYSALVQQASINNPKWILDASTMYMWDEAAVPQILEYNPAAKFVVVLRDPIARAYSHWTMATKYGLEKRSFEEAIEAEAQLPEITYGFDEGYLEFGLYGKMFQRLEKIISPEQLTVVYHEDLKEDPSKTLGALTDFLEVAAFETPEIPIENAGGGVPKNALLVKGLMGLGASLRRSAPKGIAQRAKKWLLKPPPGISRHAHEFLSAYFRADFELYPKHIKTF